MVDIKALMVEKGEIEDKKVFHLHL